MSSRPGSTSTGLLVGALLAPVALGLSAPGVALSSVAAELAVSGPASAWVLAAYSLTLAIGFALSGRLADLHGLRATLVAGAGLLAGGSVLAAASPDLLVLVAGRLLQGAGAGAVSIAALGAVNAVIEPERRPRVLAVMTAVIALLSGSGLLIGGALTSALGWRAVVALPVVALLVVPALLRLTPRAPVASGRLDATGAGLVALGAAALVLLLQAPSTGLSAPLVVLVAAVALVTGAAIVRHVRRNPRGFLPAAVAGSAAFVRLSVVGTALFAAYLGMLVAAPQLLGAEHGWGPLRIGVVLLPAAAVAVLAAHLAGVGAQRIGARATTLGLSLASAAGLLLVALAPGTITVVVGLAAAVSGFAAGQVVLLAAVPAVVGPEDVGTAVALFNAVFFLGGAVGSALVTGLVGSLSVPATVGVLAALPLAGALIASTLAPARLSTPR